MNLSDIFTRRREDLVTSLQICSRVLANKGIKALDLSNNALSITGCEAVWEWIKGLNELEYFWGNNCGLAQVILRFFKAGLVNLRVEGGFYLLAFFQDLLISELF